jgi:2-phospho-L-lactate guanylyltransferase
MWALIPAKRFSRAKSRLSPLLDHEERTLLAQAMLRDVLGIVSRSRCFAGVLLVSGDVEVARMGADYGVATLMDPTEAGTNAAVQYGLDHLGSVGAGSCVVVQGDLPFLSRAELAAVVLTLQRCDMVVVPATRDGGTNILGLARPDLISPQFGSDSHARHLRTAADLGIVAEVLHLHGAGHDIDIAVDLEFDAEPGTGAHTLALLRRLGLRGRGERERNDR